MAALLYPLLVWAGSQTSPLVLATALLVPLLGLFISHRLSPSDGLPRSRAIAHLAVAAPPMFTVIGGWLDFQHALPFGGLSVWLVLWSALLVVAALERPRPEPASAPLSHRLAMAHGISAALITLFAVVHLCNQLAGLFGGETHTLILHALRKVYRHPLVEPLLLGAVAFQLLSGVALLRRKLARATTWIEVLQNASGTYLLMFLLSHTSAVLRARYLRGIDTNWAWTSGPDLLTDPWSTRLVPYYFLAVIAFGLHGACGFRTVALGHGASPATADRLVLILGGLAALASSLIVFALVQNH